MAVKRAGNRVDRACFNAGAEDRLPYELRLMDFEAAMQDLYDFFHDINSSLANRGLHRLYSVTGS